ncbi:hypothetical protein B9Z55_015892 [Caenorhabditis nigoni]|uniref:Uncharacterized protein n=1 Tax=Caenorhabditis nigoni TaxID=1611254 RepID=A0A2G5UCB2_9PELO|nr:hypothetical protein B9Z55_015892 [Caenorhabditis nigoni]
MDSNTPIPPKNPSREMLKKNLIDFMAQNSSLFSMSVHEADYLIDILEEIKAEQFASRLGGNFENSNLDEIPNIPIVKQEVPDDGQDMAKTGDKENAAKNPPESGNLKPGNQTLPESSRSEIQNPKKQSEIPMPARSIKREIVENQDPKLLEQSVSQRRSQGPQGSANVKQEVLEKSGDSSRDPNGRKPTLNGSESVQNGSNGPQRGPNFASNGPISTGSSRNAATSQKNPNVSGSVQNDFNGSRSGSNVASNGPNFAQNGPNYGPNFGSNGSFSGRPGVSFGSNGPYSSPYCRQSTPMAYQCPNPSYLPPPPPPPPLPPTFTQNSGYNQPQNQSWRPYGQNQGGQNHRQGQKRPGIPGQPAAKKAKKTKEEYNLILPENGSTDMVNWSNLQKIQIARKVGITEEGILALVRCHFGMEKIVNFHPDDLTFYERMKNLAAYTTGAKNESLPRNLSLEDYKKWCGVVQPIKKFIEENPDARKEQFVQPWKVLMLPDSGKEDYRQWNNADVINLAKKMSISEEGIRRLKYIGLTGHKASLFRQNNMELFRKLNKDDERFPCKDELSLEDFFKLCVPMQAIHYWHPRKVHNLYA